MNREKRKDKKKPNRKGRGETIKKLKHKKAIKEEKLKIKVLAHEL
jgi:hypothetical protein